MLDDFSPKRQHRARDAGFAPCASALRCLKFALALAFAAWCCIVACHIAPLWAEHAAPVEVVSSAVAPQPAVPALAPVETSPPPGRLSTRLRAAATVAPAPPPFEETDESYHIVFSTGCSEFQDWQSIGVYSSAETVGQRGIITRIASGCSEQQRFALTRAMAHLPKRCRIHFAPNTDVKDHAGRFYKYANKPLGMMHWLMNAQPRIPPRATVALIDPDFFFLMPLWHDSFETNVQYITTGAAKKTPMPRDRKSGKVRVGEGSMIAQRYGIGGKPWTLAPGRNGQKTWAIKEYFTSIGRPRSPALASDLIGDESRAGEFYSIGAPYIALASDWLPISTNWTALMYMAVERNFGNLAEMYAMVLAVADYGIRPAMVDSLMVSNVDAGGEGWPWVDTLPMDRGCDPTILTEEFPLPTFLHYCQGYKHPGIMPNPGFLFSKYSVPDVILECPAENEGNQKEKRKGNGKMMLDEKGFLPEPDIHSVASTKRDLRNIFAHCLATRGTNQAVRDYRSWFC